MASEVRRAAMALVASREERFDTKLAQAQARERVDQALAGMRFTRVRVEREWQPGAEPPVLVVKLTPLPSMRRWLSAGSLFMAALVAASVWAIASSNAPRTVAFLVPMVTLLAIFAVPLASAGLGSQREGEEARLRKSIRSALADESG